MECEFVWLIFLPTRINAKGLNQNLFLSTFLHKKLKKATLLSVRFGLFIVTLSPILLLVLSAKFYVAEEVHLYNTFGIVLGVGYASPFERVKYI